MSHPQQYPQQPAPQHPQQPAQHPAPQHPAPQPQFAPARAPKPPLGTQGGRYVRRAGFWTHAIAGLGWGLTAPLAWIMGFVAVFFIVFGGLPADESGETLADVRDEMFREISAAPGFSMYLWSVSGLCALLVIASLIAGLVAFRRWGSGRAFWITVLGGVIPHILVFPIVLGAGSALTAGVMAFTGAPSPLIGELPTSLIVLTAVFALVNAIVHGLLGMLCSWMFAHFMRPRTQLQF